MEKYKEDFISFLVKVGALKFGEFTLKSGRISPYFVNTGMFNDGESIGKLGFFYASKVKEFGEEFDVLFGPSYKGIPLVVAASSSLAKDFGMNKGYAFDRKEAKDHGEKGAIIGDEIKDACKIIILDDVITSGGSIRDAVSLLKDVANVDIKAVVIAVDRQEKGKEEKSALKELEEELGIKITSVVTLKEVKEFLHNKKIGGKVYIDDDMLKKMEEYKEKYGVEE